MSETAIDHVCAGEARQIAAVVRQREGTATATQCIGDGHFLFWHAYTWPTDCPETSGCPQPRTPTNEGDGMTKHDPRDYAYGQHWERVPDDDPQPKGKCDDDCGCPPPDDSAKKD